MLAVEEVAEDELVRVRVRVRVRVTVTLTLALTLPPPLTLTWYLVIAFFESTSESGHSTA